MRQQVGALPIRWTGDEPRVLLVTSRETQRWIIPKGWRMRGRSNAEAAAQEALEEAGVRGRVRAKPIGRYVYAKRLPDGVEDCRVTTYLLEVSEELGAFPEMDERRRAWFTLAEAVDRADDAGLRDILHDLEPRLEALRANDAKAARKRAKAATAPAKASASASASGKASGKASDKTPVETPAGAQPPQVKLGAAAAGDEAPVEPALGDAAASDTRTRKRAAGKAARIAARRLRKASRKTEPGADAVGAGKVGVGKTRVRKARAGKGRIAPEAAE